MFGIAPLIVAASALAAQDVSRPIGREWVYYPNSNGIESRGKDVHVWHSAEGPVADHAVGVLRLDFPKKASSFELEFRVRFGAPGDVPTGVELWSGASKPLEVLADPSGGKLRVVTSGKELASQELDDVWRSFRVEGDEKRTRIWLYGKLIGESPSRGLPDMLLFGARKGREGIQTEAWLRLDRLAYRVDTEGPVPAGPRMASGKSGAEGPQELGIEAELADLRQTSALGGDGELKAWRWTAIVRIRNGGSQALDLAELPELRVLTDDYREHLCRPARSAASGDLEPWEKGRRAIKPGETEDVTFVAVAGSPTPSGRPSRVELGPRGRAALLALPPP